MCIVVLFIYYDDHYYRTLPMVIEITVFDMNKEKKGRTLYCFLVTISPWYTRQATYAAFVMGVCFLYVVACVSVPVNPCLCVEVLCYLSGSKARRRKALNVAV